MKKFAALVLALAMVLSMASFASAEEPRNILIGTTWDLYWDSFDETADANPYYSGTEADELMFANVKNVEAENGVTFEYVNLLYTGAQESINTSILAGTPDVDVYMTDLAISVPAVANGYAVDLRDVLPADHPVLTGTDPVLSYIDLGDGSVSLLVQNNIENVVAATMPLAFNLQMIEDANLEDPRDLAERGEWTWDKFVEYCQVLTKDIDGDGTTDVYGFGGWVQDYFTNLLMSNGTYVAATPTENLTSPEVAEVLQFMQDLNLKYQVMYPIPAENGWDVCRWLYRDGKVAFCPLACWMMDSNKDYSNDPSVTPLDFDMIFVEWPYGPSGDPETNKQKVTASSTYMIPVGVEDPELVFNVLYDVLNWYNSDVSVRDTEEALNWWYVSTSQDFEIQEWNYSVMYNMGLKQQYEMVMNLPAESQLQLKELVEGVYTVAQFQETYKQPVQDFLTTLMGE